MSVDIPSNFDLDVDANLNGNLNTNVSGLPTNFGLSIDRLPKIELGIDPVELKPVDLSLRLKEFPPLRMHLPANFKMGFSLLGAELFAIRLCGQAQAIAEPYTPNPCEQQMVRHDSAGLAAVASRNLAVVSEPKE